MTGETVCPGCGVRLPVTRWGLDRPVNASAECWHLNGEVVGFEMAHPQLVLGCHQLTVDAYGAQHAGGDTDRIRVAYSLVGLHLAVDRGVPGLEVRAVHQRMGRPDASWPDFPPRADPGPVTILDVAEAGVRAGSVDGHAAAITDWAAAVWQAWADQHAAVAALTDRALARPPRRR